MSDSIPGYAILKEISRGGQGVVYQAIQQSTNRKVALKVMREGPLAGAAERLRFEREVHVLGQLRHPNIVTIHDTGTAAGCDYFVMDYIGGQSLDEWMSGGLRPIDATLRLFEKICDAVNAAHLQGVIHRDLKPGNVRVDAQGEPHILDFGLAKVALGAAWPRVVTLTGQFVGSLPWSSPEQAEGAAGKIDIRTDVYALGVILYQMLTGRFPYDVLGNMRDVLDRIMTAAPLRPSAVRRQLNDEVETIVLKCLSKERERRYQSAGELGRDIRHFLAGEPIEAKRDCFRYLMAKAIHRHRRAIAVAAGATMLAAGLLVTSLALHRARSESDAIAQRAAERLEMQELLGWIESHPGAPLADERLAHTLDSACARIHAGAGTSEDLLIFAKAFLSAGFKTETPLWIAGRRVVDERDAAKTSLMLNTNGRLSAEPTMHRGGDGLAVLYSAEASLDDQVLFTAELQNEMVSLPDSGGVGIGTPITTLGTHTLRGQYRVHIVRRLAPRNSGYGLRDAQAGVDYEPIPGAVLTLSVPPLELTVIPAYPDAIPPLIHDPAAAAEFDAGLVIHSAAIARSARPDGETWLVLEATVPRPLIPVAADVRVSIAGSNETTWIASLAATLDRTTLSTRSGGSVGSTPPDREKVLIRIRLDAEPVRSLRPGDAISLRLTPSRQFAFRLELSHFLDVRVTRDVTLAEARAADAGNGR